MNSKQANEAVNRLVNPYPQDMKAPFKEVSFLGGLLHGYRRESVAA